MFPGVTPEEILDTIEKLTISDLTDIYDGPLQVTINGHKEHGLSIKAYLEDKLGTLTQDTSTWDTLVEIIAGDLYHYNSSMPAAIVMMLKVLDKNEE